MTSSAQLNFDTLDLAPLAPGMAKPLLAALLVAGDIVELDLCAGQNAIAKVVVAAGWFAISIEQCFTSGGAYDLIAALQRHITKGAL